MPGSTDTIKIDNGLLVNGLPLNSTVSVNSNENIGDLYITSGDTLNVTNGIVFTLSMDNGIVQNDGTILLSSSGNTTSLSLKSGTFTFSGSGSLTLSNNPNNQVYGNASTDALVNGATHTIQGAGQLGMGKLAITNQGTIIANQSNSLVIDPSALGFTNTGTLRATSGATLRVTGGNYTNTGGTIEAQSASTVQFESASVVGGTLTSTSSGHLVNAVASTFTGITLASGSVFDINNNTAATFNGTLTNQGTVNLNSVGNSTDFVIGSGGLTLTGGGNVMLSNNDNNRIYASPSTGTLVNMNNTISGTGQFGVGQLQIDNRGTISANNSGAALIVNPNSSGAVNTGTLQAVNGGILRLSGGGAYNNAGGTIQAQTGSTVQLDAAAISGGTLGTGGTGVISTYTSGSSLGGALTIASGAQISISNNTNLTLLASGTYSQNGTLSLASVGNTTDLIVKGGDVTLGGTGTISLSNNSNNRIVGFAATDRLVIGANQTVQGAGQIGAGVMGLVNQGVVLANLSNSLAINPSTSGVTNTGTLRATSGATLRVMGGPFQNAGGVMEAQDGSNVQFEGATVNGGSLTSIGTGRLVHATNSTFTDVTVTSNSVFNVNNNTAATFSGTLTNRGTVNLNSVGNSTDLLVPSTGLTLSGGGVVALGNNSNNRIYAPGGTGTLVNQDNTIQGVGQIGVNLLQLDNRGTIQASTSGGTLKLSTSGSGTANSGTLQAINGGILLLDGAAINNGKSGIIRAGDGSEVDLTNSTAITGGQLLTSGSGVFRTVGSGTSLAGALQIASGGQIIVTNNTNLTLLASGSYTNNGTISLASAGNSTDLKVSGGDVTISGASTIALSNNSNNRILGSGGSDRLINAGGTIQGSGQIGVDLMGLTNSGLIKANQSSSLVIDPSALGVTNTGRLRAEAGATLQLLNGTFANSGGRIEASGSGAVVEVSGATVQGGVLFSELGGVVRNAAGSTFADVNLASASTLLIPNNTAAHFTGTLANNGTVSLASAGNSTDFIIDGNVTLNGGGTIALSDNANNRLYGSVGTNVLTNLNNTIAGSGQVGAGLMGIVNQSVIKANQGSALTISPSSAGVTNTGLLRAESGATLQIQNGTIANSGGTIEAFGAGSVVSFTAATVANGWLSSSNGGVLRNASGSTFTDITLSSGATLQIPNNSSATFTGTLTSSGTVQLQSAGNQSNFIIGGSGLTLVGGAIEMSNNSNNRIYTAVGTATLVNQSSVIRGVGQLGAGITKIDNRATIEANTSGGTLTIEPNSSGVINTGFLNATGGGVLELKGGPYANTGGTIFAGTGSQVSLNAATISGGILTGSTIRATAASTLSSLTIASGTSVQIPNNLSLTLTGTIANSGTISLQSAGNSTDLIIGSGGATLTGGGVVEMTNNSNNRLYGVSGTTTLNNVNNTIRGGGQLGSNQLVLTNTGTIEANQSGTPLTVSLSNTTPFNNQGTLRASGGATLAFINALANSGVVSVDSGSTFSAQSTFGQTSGTTSLQGTLSASSVTLSGGTLQGSGTIAGATTNSATIAPGANGLATGIGTLTFSQNLTLTAASSLLLELGGASSYDKITAPAIALNGALLVSFTNGYQNTIQSGDTFTLLSTSNTNGLTGTFAGLSNGGRLTTTDGLASFLVNYQGNALVLSGFQAIPEPGTYVMMLLGTAAICLGWRRRRKV